MIKIKHGLKKRKIKIYNWSRALEWKVAVESTKRTSCDHSAVEQKYVDEADIAVLVFSISEAGMKHLHHVVPAGDRLVDTERPVRGCMTASMNENDGQGDGAQQEDASGGDTGS
jgi:hypothetical protein